MNNTAEALHLLEEKLNTLLSNYNFLLEENELLLQNVSKLNHQLLEKDHIIDELERQFNMLKIAKTIEGSGNSRKETKLKINALIREIDKCVVQLNG